MNENANWKDSYPDWNASESETNRVERELQNERFKADPSLGEDAIHLKDTIAAYLSFAKGGTISQTGGAEDPITGRDIPPFHITSFDKLTDTFRAELSPPNERFSQTLIELGWTPPNETCPNFHRFYESSTSLQVIAADGAQAWFAGFRHDNEIVQNSEPEQTGETDRFFFQPGSVIQNWAENLKKAFDQNSAFISNFDGPYFQAIEDSDTGNIIAEISSSANAGVQMTSVQHDSLIREGWGEPNEDCPNYHRKYASGTALTEVAADGFIGLQVGFD